MTLLQIDVTVSGPDQVMTGSAIVTVADQPGQAASPEPPAPAPASAPGEDLAALRARQRAQARKRPR